MVGDTVTAHGLTVQIGEDKHLHVVGSDLVIENPLLGKGLEFDLGRLWLLLWASNQHNKPDSARIRALLLNAAHVSVSRVISILKGES